MTAVLSRSALLLSSLFHQLSTTSIPSLHLISFFFDHPGSPHACMYQHLNFEKSYSLQFPLLSDIGANVADLYGSKLDIPFMGKFANRLTFIIGSDGKIEKARVQLDFGSAFTCCLCGARVFPVVLHTACSVTYCFERRLRNSPRSIAGVHAQDRAAA